MGTGYNTWNCIWKHENIFFCEAGQTLEQVVQRSCGVSLEVFKTWLDIVLGNIL